MSPLLRPSRKGKLVNWSWLMPRVSYWTAFLPHQFSKLSSCHMEQDSITTSGSGDAVARERRGKTMIFMIKTIKTRETSQDCQVSLLRNFQKSFKVFILFLGGGG